jgi:hypothetical protein
MDQDLLTQLREYGVHHHATQQPVNVEDIQGRHEAVMPTDRPTRPMPPVRRGLMFALVAAALVIAASLPLLLLTGGNEPDVAATAAPTPSTVDSPTPSSTVWSRVPHDAAVFGGAGGQRMFDVTVGGPGLVAVGESGPGDAAVWTSVDGLSWSRVPHDEAVFGGEGAPLMFDVTVGGPGLVAVGSVLIDGWSVTDAAVWTSVDGLTWSRVPHDEAVFGGARMSGVTAGGPGLVAVGTVGAISDGADRDAAVWTSVDGLIWSRVPREAVSGRSGNYPMWSVTAGGPGLVAVGWDGSDAAVWTSADGLTWSQVPHDEAIFGATGGWEMVSVTAAGPGLVAVGDAVWTSVDGRTWSLADNSADSGDTMWSVTAAGPGLVSVGDADTDAAVWVAATEE